MKEKRSSIQGVIFDLDGTLVDTLGDLTASMNAALAELGCPPRSADECRRMIGHGLRTFAARALGPEREALTDTLVAAMVAHYREHCLEETRPFDGMRELIAALTARGLRLAVLTNKNQAPAETITAHYFGAATFDPIVGAADGRPPKPDPASTRAILNDWSLAPEQVLFVGDSEPDMQTAAAAGVTAIGCEWGFRSREVLLAAGADTVIRVPGTLLELLNRPA